MPGGMKDFTRGENRVQYARYNFARNDSDILSNITRNTQQPNAMSIQTSSKNRFTKLLEKNQTS